jgi:hypothetical protein
MNEHKSLVVELVELLDRHLSRRKERAKNKSEPSYLSRTLHWLTPNGGTLLLIAILLLTQNAWARPEASPTAPGPSATTVNYQGRLADSGGAPLDGSYGMSFSLWDAPSGGSLVWGPESHAAVPVSEGLFSVGLGSQTGGGIPTSVWNGDRYLEITVGGETLAPRELIRSVPIAGMALVASKLSVGRQNDTVNSTDDRTMMAGWGYIQGNGTPGITEQVNFGFAFAEPPIVVVTFLGGSTSLPSGIGNFQFDAAEQKVFTVVPDNITASGFRIGISRNAHLFAPTAYYGYSWIAIGAVP